MVLTTANFWNSSSLIYGFSSKLNFDKILTELSLAQKINSTLEKVWQDPD